MLQLMRGGASSPAVAMATIQLMALSSNTGWDFNMVSGGRADYSHQPILLHPPISSSACLQNYQTIPLFSLPSLHYILEHYTGPYCRLTMWWAPPGLRFDILLKIYFIFIYS